MEKLQFNIRQITLFVIILLIGPLSIVAQDQYYVLQEIVHNTTDARAKMPDQVDVDSKGGFVEFSVTYNGDCTERYRFELNFDQDMRLLKSTEQYGFTISTQKVNGNCRPSPARDPFMTLNAANGSSSGLIAATGYQPIVNSMAMVRGWDRLYTTNAFGNSKTGTLSGAMTTQRRARDGAYTWMRLAITGASNVGAENGVRYEVLFIYKISDSAPELEFSCPPIDCSGYPGTVPVWNFQMQKGECWCPEGSRWDKMIQRCVAD